MDEEGRFRITDRKKDMIAVSGIKAFPHEIEDVLALHPACLRRLRSALRAARERLASHPV